MFPVKSIIVVAALLTPSMCALGPRPSQIKNLVTFGDSYTDVVVTGDGGVSWPTYAASYGKFALYPYARAGATCSNNLTPKPWPSVFESQLPTYFAQKNNGSLHLDSEKTIYTLWIGTNDVGSGALLTGQGAPGVTLVDTTTCAINWIKELYKSGARNFLFQNMVPLYKLPMYSADSYPNRYWTAQRNTTEWNVFMKELVHTGNTLSKLMLQTLAPSLHDAHIGLFDSYALFEDMIENPSKYLNGTATPNITGAVKACIFEENESTSNPGNCTVVTGSEADSYLWFDELHPSEQADRIVAREVTAAIRRTSEKWTMWLS